MKKTLVITLSLLSITFLAGCGNNELDNWPAQATSNFLENIHSCNWEKAYSTYAVDGVELYQSMKTLADFSETSLETVCKELIDDKKVSFEVIKTNFVWVEKGKESEATEAEVEVILTTEGEEPTSEYIKTILVNDEWKVEISELDSI